MTLASIDWGKLAELVWTAAVASVVVSVAFALLIHGATRAADLRRSRGGSGTAVAYGVVALLAALVVIGSVVFGIFIIVA